LLNGRIRTYCRRSSRGTRVAHRVWIPLGGGRRGPFDGRWQDTKDGNKVKVRRIVAATGTRIRDVPLKNHGIEMV
jgi:hypothetical protein